MRLQLSNTIVGSTVLFLVIFLFSSCGSVAVEKDVKSLPTIPSELTLSALQNFSYTIVSPSVRTLLSRANVGFTIRLQNGSAVFPHASELLPYDSVSVESNLSAEGDLNNDGRRDLVTVLRIGSGHTYETEIVAVTLSGGTLRQLASFPLGNVEVSSLAIDGTTLIAHALIPLKPSSSKKELTLRFSL